MTSLRTVDFRTLSRSMQERFVACTRGSSAPHPQLVLKPRSLMVPLSIGAIVSGLASLAWVLRYGFGRLDRAAALHATTALPLYVLPLTLVLMGVTELLLLEARRRALPYGRAVYLFPLTLVDARDSRLQVSSLADVRRVERSTRGVRVVFPDATVTLPVDTEAEADETCAAIESGRARARALSAGDAARVSQTFGLDPLQQPRLSSPLGPRAGLVEEIPRWRAQAATFAPLLALALSPPIAWARNAVSDRAMFAEAVARDDVGAYDAYLAHGGRRSEEVRARLLPRAELREAQKVGSVEAIDRFRSTHPGAIPEETAAARRGAMLDELARAKKPGTVPALQEFVRRRPDHGLDKELREAMHSLFVPALASYRLKPMRSPEVRSFVERLFAWSEAKAHAGSAATTIQVRFRRRVMPSMRKADKMVAKHHWFLGEASYPSRYFDAAHAARREKQCGDALANRIRDAFGPTVFTVEVGPRLPDAAKDEGVLPEVTEPTLYITHGEEWRGRFDGSITRPRGIWVGVGHRFDAVFVIPGDPRPLSFALETGDAIPKQLIREQPPGAPSLEETLYGEMAEQAFRTFFDRLSTTVLPPEPRG